MKPKTIFLIFLILIFRNIYPTIAQTTNDSLYSIFNNKSNSDSIRLKAIHELAWGFLYNNPDTAYFLAQKELQLSIDKKNKLWEARAYNTIGSTFQNKSDYSSALSYHLKGLRIREGLNDKKGLASSLNNIGSVYNSLGEYEKALNYHLRSLKIRETIDDKKGIAASLNNIGSLYYNLFMLEKSLYYQTRSLKIREVIGDKKGIANSLINLAKVYKDMLNYPKALECLSLALKTAEENNDKQSTAYAFGGMSDVYLVQGQYQQAILSANKAIKLCEEIGDLDFEKEFQSVLYAAYKEIGDSKNSLIHYERYVLLKDSVFKQENQKQIMQNEMNYEFEKKEHFIKVEQEKKDAIAKEEKQTQNIILIAVVLGLLIVVTFSLFLYNRFRITSRQKNIIENQKHIIEEHQKETIDSITYAKRIQQAIIPPIDLIQKKLPNTFVMYKPKDIVAGDFYWMEEIDNNILIAAADCTGHGVPGAMVSVVCSGALNRAVKEFRLTNTGEILDKVTDLVLETFERSIDEVKDGMDISLVSINKTTKQIQWSGANNPLWYFYNNTLNEITADKQPIGKSDFRKPFTTHLIEYKNDTTFYLFTDGYADQFGGPKGKKFKYKQFQETLAAVHHLSPADKNIALNKAFESWRGELEQVDDVCIIGISI